jgi:hypothetical protein
MAEVELECREGKGVLLYRYYKMLTAIRSNIRECYILTLRKEKGKAQKKFANRE